MKTLDKHDIDKIAVTLNDKGMGFTALDITCASKAYVSYLGRLTLVFDFEDAEKAARIQKSKHVKDSIAYHAGKALRIRVKSVGTTVATKAENTSEIPRSEHDTTNPKDLLGVVKAPLSLLPPIAVAHGAHAMSDGATKYGPYNWREKKVKASIYVDACLRHLLAWQEGEECAPDSGVHHLGHGIACMGILLDAIAHGCLVDDRPNGNGVLSKVLNEISEKLKTKHGEPKPCGSAA